MNANRMIGAVADVQMAVSGLLGLARQVRDDLAPTDDNLRLLEDGIHVVGAELLEIAKELQATIRDTDRANSEALQLLDQCQELLRTYERQAETDGLIPAIVQDRSRRPADAFSTEKYDVSVDQAAGVVVIREKARHLADNVVPFNSRPRSGTPTGGAA